MAKFRLDAVIDDGEDGAAAWEIVKTSLLSGKSVELVRRVQDGKRIIEVRRWTGYRDDDSNHKTAEPGEDHVCGG